MAALALIFAIQDYEPSPFYYFDEVDQNLDPFNSEKIAALCRMRSGWRSSSWSHSGRLA